MESDTDLVVDVSQQGAKRLISIAELICSTCRTSGVTTMDLLEHNLTPKTKEAR